MRGSSDILAAVDSHISVRRASNDKMLLTFTQEKQRFDIELEPFQIRAEIDGDKFQFVHFRTTEGRPDKGKLLFDSVIELLEEHGELMQADLLNQLMARGVTTNEHELRSSLRFWVEQGDLPQPKKGKGKSKLYRLAGGTHESE